MSTRRTFKPMPWTRETRPTSQSERRRQIEYARQGGQRMIEYPSSSRAGPVYRRQAPAEVKYFDVSFSQSPISSAADWTGTEVPCTNYLQSDGSTLGAYTDSALIPSATGSGYGQVVGSKYSIKKMRIRGMIYSTAVPDQPDPIAANSVRLVAVLDAQPNGAQAQGESVFTDMGTATQDNYSFLAMAGGSGGRFRVLKDEWFDLQPAIAQTDGANTGSSIREGKSFNFTYSPKNPISVRIKSNASTPAVAALSDVNLFLLAYANQPNAIIEGCARCYYLD